uniref:Uncharacterized protein n=1 Tax=Syphacia muris TaxID=451379 RepID=A0A0N5AN83_9BILA
MNHMRHQNPASSAQRRPRMQHIAVPSITMSNVAAIGTVYIPKCKKHTSEGYFLEDEAFQRRFGLRPLIHYALSDY